MIKKGDNVIVRIGASKGKTGAVLKVFPKLGVAIVEGANMKKKHKRGTAKGKGSVVELPHPISISNLAKK